MRIKLSIIKVNYTHHTLLVYVFGSKYGKYQYFRRRSQAIFLSDDLHRLDTLGCSILSTKSPFHFYSLLTLDFNYQFTIPIATLFFRTIPLLVTFLNHDNLLPFFPLFTITLFSVLIKDR